MSDYVKFCPLTDDQDGVMELLSKETGDTDSLLTNSVDKELYFFQAKGHQRDGGFMTTNRIHREKSVFEVRQWSK